MAKARIQSICRAKSFNLGYYDGIRVFLRSVTERNIAMFFYTTIIFVYFGNRKG